MNTLKVALIDSALNEGLKINPYLNIHKIKKLYLKTKNKKNSWYIIQGLLNGLDISKFLCTNTNFNQYQIDMLINNLMQKSINKRIV